MTPLEKKRYFDTIQKEFNAYKIAGSMLMQNNQIDADMEELIPENE